MSGQCLRKFFDKFVKFWSGVSVIKSFCIQGMSSQKVHVLKARSTESSGGCVSTVFGREKVDLYLPFFLPYRKGVNESDVREDNFNSNNTTLAKPGLVKSSSGAVCSNSNTFEDVSRVTCHLLVEKGTQALVAGRISGTDFLQREFQGQ